MILFCFINIPPLIISSSLRERDLQVEELLEQVKLAEKSATSTIDSLKSEINAHKSEVAHLKSELDQQRKKNDVSERFLCWIF